MSSRSPVPKHVAVVMDGNRRFSKRVMAKPWKGHEWGAEKLERLLHWCTELGIEELTVYAFSVQNFERPKTEFDALMRIFLESAERLRTRLDDSTDALASRVRVTFIGRLGMFPKELQTVMREIMERTARNTGFLVNIAMGYGGREEVIDAVKKIGDAIARGALRVEDINDQVFANALYLQSEPDLIIRTGGEHRTSNFLIWQAHYSEWVFLEKLWPEFEREDLVAAIESYAARERRLGK